MQDKTFLDVDFEPDFALKILKISFRKPTMISSVEMIHEWKRLWCEELKAWHSPYKALIDANELRIDSDPMLYAKLEAMLKFFKGFYLRKVVFWGCSFPVKSSLVSFEKFEDACVYLGIRDKSKALSSNSSLRDIMHVDNHLAEKIMELSFEEDVELSNSESVGVIKSKLTHNLMQWHSEWCLLIDISRVKGVSGVAAKDLEKLMRFLHGFFMVSAVAYGMKVPEEVSSLLQMPFFRSRHKALAHIHSLMQNNADGNSQSQGDCISRSSS